MESSVTKVSLINSYNYFIYYLSCNITIKIIYRM
uniref:Uncharacterized protein n=1 Tax=Myoviridae sp. ctCo31 TaxID=2825053 RepID=A0A8S5UM54_9CAUD|nr:MAG TPA: hypothetical protein [Myoviridae sp. ctCo31]